MAKAHVEGEEISTEDKLTCIADRRRREILDILQQQETPVDRRDLAEEVATAERDTDPADLSEHAIESVEITLHHNHLPRLDEAGFLTYDTQQNLVTPQLTSEIPVGVLNEL